jgi:hypothetical protein
MLTAEPATLAAMLGPAARIAGAAARRPIDAGAVAGRIVGRCRADIMTCVEGEDTIGNLGRSIDTWESVIPDIALHEFSHEDIGNG